MIDIKIENNMSAYDEHPEARWKYLAKQAGLLLLASACFAGSILIFRWGGLL